MDLVYNRRAAESVVGIVLLVGVVVIIGAVTTTLAFGFIEDAEEGQAYSATFSFETRGGELLVSPEYRPNDVTYHLKLNGQRAHTWTGDQTQRLRCLFPGDTATIVAEGNSTKNSYVLREYEVQSATKCGLSGTAAQFAYAQVGAKQLSLRRQNYEFTLYIDPSGSEDVNGDTDYPLSNDWHFQERFDQSVEYTDADGNTQTLNEPVYLFVLADNANYGSDPPDDHYEEQDNVYQTVGSDPVEVVPTPQNGSVSNSEVEPTNDIYLLFHPGCSESTMVMLTERASYDNEILLGDTVIIDDTNTFGDGETVTGDFGVTCT